MNAAPKRPAAAPLFPMSRGNQPSVFDRALMAHQRGQLHEAEALYKQVPATDPRHAIALHHRGLIRAHADDHQSAAELVTLSLRLNPRDAAAQANLGNILYKLGNMQEAVAACDRALALDSRNPSAWNNKGNALRGLSRFELAIDSYDRALTMAPDFAEAWANRGTALRHLGQNDAALANYEKSLQLAPTNTSVWTDKAGLLFKLQRFEEALFHYDQALAIDPGLALASTLGMMCMQHLAQWHALPQRWQEQLDRIHGTGIISLAFPLLAHPGVTAQQLATGLGNFFSDKFGKISAAPFDHSAETRRPRVAFLSADFRDHALSYLMAGVFEHFDHERFEIHAFSLENHADSALKQRLLKCFDSHVSIQNMSDEEVVDLMRRQNIDIAVDLMGHTAGSRFGIFARRCAPIQVNYLGYPGTSGTPFIDYIIGDRWVTPLDQAEAFSEQLVLMPDSFQANDDLRSIAADTPSRAALGLPENAFVFCCFNNTYKITPQMYDIWMRLLSHVPGSVLWLLGDSETARRNLRLEAQARGVDPERIVFAQRRPYEEYLAQYRQADLFLDTLPFNAGTTASDALWAGLPVLTQLGHTFAGRMAASLLDNVGLPELIARSAEDYEALALKLASEPALLKTYRDRLAASIATAPLFNTARFTRHLERAFLHMIERQRLGLPPLSFEMAPTD